MNIKRELDKLKIRPEIVEKALLEAVKVKQGKYVEDLKKQGKFELDMTPEQITKASAEKSKASASKPAAAGGAKKEEAPAAKKGKK